MTRTLKCAFYKEENLITGRFSFSLCLLFSVPLCLFLFLYFSLSSSLPISLSLSLFLSLFLCLSLPLSLSLYLSLCLSLSQSLFFSLSLSLFSLPLCLSLSFSLSLFPSLSVIFWFQSGFRKPLAPEPRTVRLPAPPPYCGLLGFYLRTDWTSLPHYFSTLLLVTKFVALDTSFHGTIKWNSQ